MATLQVRNGEIKPGNVMALYSIHKELYLGVMEQRTIKHKSLTKGTKVVHIK